MLIELLLSLISHSSPDPWCYRDEVSILPTQPFLRYAQNDYSIIHIAKQVTVRILGNPGIGSGVIIGHEGQTYTVLTNNHVVTDSYGQKYSVLTADNLIHTGKWIQIITFNDLDLALVKFNSSNFYNVVEFGNSSKLLLGDCIVASGFPNWRTVDSNTIENTKDWGVRAFHVTTGSVAMMPKKSLSKGYQLGYTNEIENGMSGGPVLDRNGRLVGINGRLKNPFQGMSVFKFTDGTSPSIKMFQQMEALSWAIPSNTFQHLIRKYYINSGY
jgi:serine protease Do